MNVEHATFPLPDKFRGEEAHISSEHNIVGLGFSDFSIEDGVKLRPLHALVALRERWDVLSRGKGEARRVRVVGCNKNDFERAVWLLGCINKRRHVRAATRNQDGNARLSHCAWQTSLPLRSTSPKSRGRCIPFRQLRYARCGRQLHQPPQAPEWRLRRLHLQRRRPYRCRS